MISISYFQPSAEQEKLLLNFSKIVNSVVVNKRFCSILYFFLLIFNEKNDEFSAFSLQVIGHDCTLLVLCSVIEAFRDRPDRNE